MAADTTSTITGTPPILTQEDTQHLKFIRDDTHEQLMLMKKGVSRNVRKSKTKENQMSSECRGFGFS